MKFEYGPNRARRAAVVREFRPLTSNEHNECVLNRIFTKLKTVILKWNKFSHEERKFEFQRSDFEICQNQIGIEIALLQFVDRNVK